MKERSFVTLTTYQLQRILYRQLTKDELVFLYMYTHGIVRSFISLLVLR